MTTQQPLRVWMLLSEPLDSSKVNVSSYMQKLIQQEKEKKKDIKGNIKGSTVKVKALTCGKI